MQTFRKRLAGLSATAGLSCLLVWLFNYSYLNIKICHERKQFTSISAVSHFPVISPTKPHMSRPVKQDFTFSECLNCTKFDHLILKKIIKIVACHILRLKCTKFDFGWGSAPDPAGGAHSAPPDPLAGFKGSYF